MRTVLQVPRHSEEEVEPCNTDSCNKCVDGVWGDWNQWSRCSSECAPAFRVRHRDMAQKATQCGKQAVGLEDEFDMCEELPPCQHSQDCKVSEWTEWSNCSSTCFGVQERRRPMSAVVSCICARNVILTGWNLSRVGPSIESIGLPGSVAWSVRGDVKRGALLPA